VEKIKYLVTIQLLIVLCIIAGKLKAQDKLDSLQNVYNLHIEKYGEDTIAVKILEELFDHTFKVAPYIALEYAAQGKQIAENLKDSLWIAIMNQHIGNIYYVNKVYYLAMESYFAAYEIFVNQHNKKMIAECLLDIGNTYVAQEVFDLAEEYFERSRKIFTEINNQTGLAKAYEMLGVINMRYDEEIAIEMFTNSLHIYDSTKNTLEVANIQLHLAKVYSQTNDIDKAIDQVSSAMIIYRKNNNLYKVAESYLIYGDIYFQKKDFQRSFYYYNLALNLFGQMENDIKLAETYNKICQISLLQNKNTIVIEYAQLALDIGESYSNLNIKKEACYFLAQAYESLNNYKQSLYFHKRYSSIIDSLFNEKKKKQFSEFQVSLETQKQQKEIELLQINSEKDKLELSKDQYRRNTIYTIIISLLIFGVVIIMYFRYKDKERTNLLLFESNQQMQTEIQERKIAEVELRISEEKYRLLFRKTPVGIMQFDDNLKITAFNDRFSQIFKLNKKQVIGRSVSTIFPSEVMSGFNKSIENQGRVYREEREILTRAETVYVSLTVKPYFYNAGTTTEKGGIMIVEDITERKKAENSFLESENKNRALLQLIPDAIFLLNKEGDYIEARIPNNPDASVNYINKNLKDILPPDLLKKYLDAFKKAIDYNTSQYLEYPLTKNGVIRFYEARFIVSHDDKILLIIRDISRLKETEQHLKEAKQNAETANRAKSEFFTNVLSELQEPINTIIDSSNNIKNELTSDNPVLPIISEIYKSCRQIADTIIDIHNLSKLESGKFEFLPEPINPVKIITDIKSIFSQKAKDKNLEIILNYSSDLPTKIIFDEVRMRQILFNLVGNAIKFTNQGSITINLQKHSSNSDNDNDFGLTFEVTDTGIGIPPDKIEKVFEPFMQDDITKTKRYTGVGLGLSVTKKLVNIMNGEIYVESELNKGTTFRIDFESVSHLQSHIDDNEKHEILENIIFNNASVLIVSEDDILTDTFKQQIEELNIDSKKIPYTNKIETIIENTLPNMVAISGAYPPEQINNINVTLRNSPRSILRTIPILIINNPNIKQNSNKFKNQTFEILNLPTSKDDIKSKLRKFLPYAYFNKNNENKTKLTI